MFTRWLRDESGQAMSEYGLLIAVIVIGVIAAATLLRDKIAGAFSVAASKIDAASQINN